MLLEVVALRQPLGLQPRPDDLKRMGERSGHHARYNPRKQFVVSHSLQFLVEHVVEASKSALLDAAGQPAAEEALEALLAVDVPCGRHDRGIAMEVCQLEARLDDVQRVGEEGARQPRHGGYDEVLTGSHPLRLERPQAGKVDIASQCSLERGRSQSLVEATQAVGIVDIPAGCLGVLEDVAAFVERLELPRRQHECHFDVLEGLEQRGRDDAAEHPVKSLLAYHSQYIIEAVGSTISGSSKKKRKEGNKIGGNIVLGGRKQRRAWLYYKDGRLDADRYHDVALLLR